MFSLFKPNPFDQLLKQNISAKNILIAWNRGLGDIPLGLIALCHRIRHFIPDASISFFTRDDLAPGFTMVPGVKAYAISSWKRGTPISWEEGFKEHGLSFQDFDILLDKVDPTKWLKWQLGTFTPKLVWNSAWDQEIESFGLGKEKNYIGLHLQTETGQFYRYEKNWPVHSWQKLISYLTQTLSKKVVLFGLMPDEHYQGENIIDLRGKTSLFAMLSVIKNSCSHLVAPDSGVLSTIYYVDSQFPLHVVSLWADPKQGVLRQKVASPNSLFCHKPLIGKRGDVSRITVEEVIQELSL